ncbi:MAG: hypothetical protein KAT34_22520 [Candidatus Aminicenantes bacterium]|nr:hypothetical protein [Candidatus Aminicenantes bacterium]
MKNSKVRRLAIGLLILSSLFLFQGNGDEDSCDNCLVTDDTGSLEILNTQPTTTIKIIISKVDVTFLLEPHESKVTRLSEGSYIVTAFIAGFKGQLIDTRTINMKRSIRMVTSF